MMKRLWIAICTSLTFVSWVSSDKVVLMQEPECNSCDTVWTWDRIPVKATAWKHTASGNYYTTCDLLSSSLPNNWLRSGIIPVREGKRLDVTVEYLTFACRDRQPYNFCNNSFSAYVWESNTTIAIPHPIASYSSYRRFATINHPQNVDHSLLLPLEVNSKFIVLGFRDQGGCRRLYSVKVSYDVCVGKTLKDSLVSLQETVPPLRNLRSIPVEGKCTTDSVQAVQGSMAVLCESSGEWNTSLLEGRCVCKENRESTGGICSACSPGTYNDGEGFNCTVIPSEARDVVASFVNQNSAVISWSPPAAIGTETDVLYDIECKKSCDYYGKSCDDEACDSKISYLSQTEDLNMTNIKITNLASFVNYTCKISAKNRVSKVAERNHGVKGTFALLNLRTNGTAPGKPEVAALLDDDGSIALSWKLKCKNGKITGYRVTYFRMDESSDTKTLITKNKEVQIKNLASGKTYEFRVFALNNFGTGPPGVKTFKIPNGSGFSSDNTPSSPATIIAISVTVSGVIILIVLTLLGTCIYRQRKTQARLEKRLGDLQAAKVNIAHEGEDIHMEVVMHGTNSDDTVHQPAEYMDISKIYSFELERNDIKFVRLLGSGNFGEVFKATMGNDTVAVKSLKDTATPKDKVDMAAELNVMKSLKPHPHVLKLIGCCSLCGPLLIVLEYLPYGDLLGYLRKSRGHSDSYNSGENPTSRLTARDLLSFAWMIADGMNYLAKMKIVHRDLAARNILVSENKVCKISDFGLARDVNADIYVRTSQARLPVKWMPPESLFRGESSTMSDVWSYGIVLWEVFTIGDSPYPGVKAKQVASLMETGYRMPRPIHISEELFSIMSECWSEKPEDRPTFQWICAAVKRLISMKKNYVNLDVYNDEDYVNFDMFD